MTKYNALISLVVLLLALYGCNKKCESSNCSEYSTQTSAQTSFDADRECHSDLDSDNDGLACEHLTASTTKCQTSSLKNREKENNFGSVCLKEGKQNEKLRFNTNRKLC